MFNSWSILSFLLHEAHVKVAETVPVVRVTFDDKHVLGHALDQRTGSSTRHVVNFLFNFRSDVQIVHVGRLQHDGSGLQHPGPKTRGDVRTNAVIVRLGHVARVHQTLALTRVTDQERGLTNVRGCQTDKTSIVRTFVS